METYLPTHRRGSIAPGRLLLALWLAVALSLAHTAQTAVPASWRANPDATRGAALTEVREGRSSQALERLERALGEKEPDAALARERERIGAWTQLVERFWNEVIEAQTKVTLTVRGRELRRVRITGRGDDGELFVGMNKHGIRTFRTEELELGELVTQLGKASDELRGDSARRWMQLLLGDRRAQRSIEKAKDAELALLKEDASRYPDLLALGDTLLALELLDEPVARLDAAAVELELTRLDRIQRRRHKTLAELRPHLRRTMVLLWERKLDLEGIGALTHAQVRELKNGRFELSYDFEQAEQALDFEILPGYLESIRSRLVPLVIQPRETTFQHVAGTLEGQGSGCVRLAFPLEAPLKARWKLQWTKPKGIENSGAVQFLTTFLDDAEESYLGVMDLGKLEAHHAPSGRREVAWDTPNAPKFRIGKVYEFELSRTAEGVTTVKIDGKLVNELRGTKLVLQGGTCLWVHSDLPVRVHELSLEGRVQPDALQQLRRKRVEAELARRGWSAGK